MPAHRPIPLVAVVLALLCTTAPPVAAETDPDAALPSPDWVPDLDEGLRNAADGDRPVLVDVYADWCQPCIVMERETYAHPEVIAALDTWVAVKLDAEVHDRLATRYDVSILPTTLVLESNGRLVASIPGQLGPDRMLDLIARVDAGWSGYREAMARPGDADAMERAAGYLVTLGNFAGAARSLQLSAMQLRGAGAPSERVHEVELKIAQAKLADGAWREAEAEFDRLAKGGAVPTIRAMALVGLADSAERRGQTSNAERIRRKIRDDYPEVAARLGL